jgi:predicted lipase
MSYVPDPSGSQEKLLGIHSGFFKYLFSEESSSTSRNKYEKVLEHLRPLLQEHKGYHVRTTGHSLGGALASIFAFFAACEHWMPPIECVTFGAPRFGNTQFFRAFRRLEEEGRVSLLRVVNGGDPVTSAPDRLNCGCSVFFQSTVYRHVGMELRFSASRTMIGRTMAFYCPFLHKSYFRQWFDEVVKGFLRFLRKLCMLVFVRLLCCCCSAHCGLSMHSCKTYMDRIGRESEDLVKHRLREIYQKLRR